MKRILLISLYDEYCLGIRYLSSYLQANGHFVYIVNFKSCAEINKKPFKEELIEFNNPPNYVTSTEISLLVTLVEKLNPDYIGFSFTANFFSLANLLTQKLRHLRKPIIWGGVVATLDPEFVLQFNDIICIGEGEEALLEFIEQHSNNGDYKRVKNFWFKENSEIIKNDIRPPYPKLDDFPFSDFDFKNKFLIYDGTLYENKFPQDSHLTYAAMVITGRGCPYSCTYCCNNYFNEKLYPRMMFLRRRSVDNVIAELKYRINTMPNLTTFEFTDDVFTINIKWLREFRDKYKTETNKLFWCYTHPLACNKEVAEILKECGILYTIIGIQSGSEHILFNVFNRKTSREKILSTCNILNSVGIKYVVDLIGTNPFETEQDRWETLSLLLKLPHPFSIHPVNPLALYPGHKITERALQEGYIHERKAGIDCYMIEEEKIHRFWNALLQLPQFKELSYSTIINLAKDELLRNNPEVIEELLQVLSKYRYYKGNLTLLKDEYIELLENERRPNSNLNRSWIKKIVKILKKYI